MVDGARKSGGNGLVDMSFDSLARSVQAILTRDNPFEKFKISLAVSIDPPDCTFSQAT